MTNIFNPHSLLGKSEDDAKKIGENYGYKIRVTIKDGNPLFVTADYRTDRINVGTISGKISSINGIG